MLQENDFKISASCFASEDRCLEIRGKMQSKVWQPQIGRALLKARLNFRHRFFAKLPVACHTRHDGRSAVYIVLSTVRRTNCMIRCEWPQRRSQGKQITRRADRTVGVASSRRKHRSRWCKEASDVYKRPTKLIHLSPSMTYHLLMFSIAQEEFGPANITAVLLKKRIVLNSMNSSREEELWALYSKLVDSSSTPRS